MGKEIIHIEDDRVSLLEQTTVPAEGKSLTLRQWLAQLLDPKAPDPPRTDLKVRRRTSVSSLVDAIRRDAISVATPLLPAGTRFYQKLGEMEVVIVEEAPRTRTVLFSRDRSYTLAFPYVVHAIHMYPNGKSGYRLSAFRLFYRNKPLGSLDDSLCHCNLPNVHYSDYPCVGDAGENAWERAYQTPKEAAESTINAFWQSNFNRDLAAENYEPSTGIDRRIANLRAWEESSASNPLFVLKIPWRDAGTTVRQVINNMLGGSKTIKTPTSVSDLTDILYRCPEKEV